MEFNIDFGNALKPQAPRDETCFAAEQGVVSDLGNEECLFEVRRTGEVHAMTTQVLGALDLSRGFRPLDEHAAVIAQRVPGLDGRADAVRRVLDSLVQRGLLLSDGDYVAELTREVRREPAALRAVFVRACDRPAQLAALLGTLADYERKFGARRRYVVLDDSRDPANARRNAEHVARFAQDTGARALSLDATRMRALADKLSRQLPASASAAREALAPDAVAGEPGGGRGYNVAALLAAGGRYAMLDEDFLLPLKRQPGAAGLRLVGSPDMATRFYASRDAALADGVALDDDPFENHLAWCGRSLGQLLAAAASPADLKRSIRGLEPSRAPHLRPDARIVATANGHRGDSGTARADWLFLLDPASRDAFWAERDSYLRHLEGGAVWFGAPDGEVLEQGHFTPFCIDGTSLVPPTRARGRSEDLLFGMLCHVAEPRSVVLHTPLTIGHAQEGARRRSDTLREPETPGLNHFLNDLLGSEVGFVRADAPGDRLATVAGRLRDVANASVARRRELLDEFLRFRRADLVKRLQAQFALAGDKAPVWWQADVRELITANGKALTQRTSLRLGGWPTDLDDDAAAQRLAQELRAFAGVLEAWPALWQAAAQAGDGLLEGA